MYGYRPLLLTFGIALEQFAITRDSDPARRSKNITQKRVLMLWEILTIPYNSTVHVIMYNFNILSWKLECQINWLLMIPSFS